MKYNALHLFQAKLYCTIFSPVLGDQIHASWPPGFGLAVYRADVCLACTAGESTTFEKLQALGLGHWKLRERNACPQYELCHSLITVATVASIWALRRNLLLKVSQGDDKNRSITWSSKVLLQSRHPRLNFAQYCTSPSCGGLAHGHPSREWCQIVPTHYMMFAPIPLLFAFHSSIYSSLFFKYLRCWWWDVWYSDQFYISLI